MPEPRRYGPLMILIAALSTALLSLPGCFGPSTEERVREVFRRHEEAVDACYEKRDQARQENDRLMEALARGDLAAGLAANRDAATAGRSYAQCMADVKSVIDEELKAAGLAEAEEVEAVWADYQERHRQREEEERRRREEDRQQAEEEWQSAPETVLDERTGLTWTGRSHRGDLNAAQAARHCDDLALAGADDWRLPSIEELETLFDGSPEPPLGVQVLGSGLWSSTPYYDKGTWAFLLESGGRAWFPLEFSTDMKALCVRAS